MRKPYDIAQWKLENYQILREAAYLPTEEQDDLRYWDKINGTDNWNVHRAEIKALWPKG